VRRDENDDAWIEFGDGKYGQIPRRGQNNIVVFYRVGGGIKGNVPSQVITEPVGQVEFLKYVYNEKAATGGAEAESSVEAATRGPQLFRAMGRAVTAQDYEAHAREFGVGKIRARAASWNRIELFVAPAGGGYPTDTFKKSLLTYLENKRIITSILDIQDPQFVTVCIEGDLEIEARFFHEQVRQQVEKAIHELLAFENVEFGDRLYLSKVYEAIEAVPGVASVYVSRFARSDSTRDLPEDGKLEFDWSEIPRTGPVQWKGDRAGGKWEWRTAAG
jgi:predicted phage baseplate assembly protein